MSVNRNTSAADKTSNPPPLSLVDYSDDEEQATPQQSQTSQPMSGMDKKIHLFGLFGHFNEKIRIFLFALSQFDIYIYIWVYYPFV